jgi:transcriptional activator of cad operon
MPRKTKIRVGDWCVDPTANLISRDGKIVRIEARAMRLLLDLADHAGDVVSIDELLDRLWPGVVVTSDSVYQAVASLRRLLGDDHRRPRYVATVPRRGYRLIAVVGPWKARSIARSSRQTGALALLTAGGFGAVATVGAVLVYGAVSRPSVAPCPLETRHHLAAVRDPAFADMTSAMTSLRDDTTEKPVDKLARQWGLRTPGNRSSL